MACRNMEKGAEAKAEIEKQVENAQLTLLKLDLSNLQAVEAFVESFNELEIPLHILINNAGIMAIPYRETANGFEMQFGTNHLGHFHMTNLLLPKLIQGQPSRVVVLSSSAHKIEGIRWNDISGKGTWYTGGLLSRWNAYGQSKTANLLFAVELNRRMHMEGHKITANALHPGVINTELDRDLGGLEMAVSALGAPFKKTIPQGAATTIYVATAPELEGIGGKFFADCNEETPKAYASNPRYAERLWKLSEEMIAKAPKADESGPREEAEEEEGEEQKKENSEDNSEENKSDNSDEPEETSD